MVGHDRVYLVEIVKFMFILIVSVLSVYLSNFTPRSIETYRRINTNNNIISWCDVHVGWVEDSCLSQVISSSFLPFPLVCIWPFIVFLLRFASELSWMVIPVVVLPRSVFISKYSKASRDTDISCTDLENAQLWIGSKKFWDAHFLIDWYLRCMDFWEARIFEKYGFW